jgi:Kdo2-lipid IVA lauroyltransferase/acyltransferase
MPVAGAIPGRKVMKIRKYLTDSFVYYVVRSVVALVRTLPRSTGISLMRGIAIFCYLLMKKYRRLTIRHLTMAFGEEKSRQEIHRLARKVFLHFATAGVDAMRMPVYIKKGMDRYVAAKNIYYLNQVRNEGRGYILLTGHFGNWELLGAWVAQKNYNPHVIGATLSNPKLNQFISNARNQAGYTYIAREQATRGILKAMKRGEPVALLIDQDTRIKGMFVDFFGIKAHTPIGPAVIARKFKAPILPIVMRLKKDRTYELECFEPIRYVDTGHSEADTEAVIQRCSDLYESIIRRDPEQWVWMHERWRKRPEDRCGVNQAPGV